MRCTKLRWCDTKYINLEITLVFKNLGNLTIYLYMFIIRYFRVYAALSHLREVVCLVSIVQFQEAI